MTRRKIVIAILIILCTIPVVLLTIGIVSIFYLSSEHSKATELAVIEANKEVVIIKNGIEKYYSENGYYPSNEVMGELFDEETLVNSVLARRYIYRTYTDNELDVNGKYNWRPANYEGIGCRYELLLYPDSFMGESGGDAIVNISNSHCPPGN